MNSHLTKEVIIFGRKTMQNSLLVGFINSQTEYKCKFVTTPKWDKSYFNNRKSLLVLIDAELSSCTEMHGLLTSLNNYKKRLKTAFYAVDDSHQKELMIAWPMVCGIFYNSHTKDQIVKGIEGIFDDQLWLPRDLIYDYLQRTRTCPAAYSPTVAVLSKREKQILLCAKNGATNEVIAKELFLSPHTVKSHLYNLYKKLGFSNRLQMILWARKNIDSYDKDL